MKYARSVPMLKSTPGQERGRDRWILDTVRANQLAVSLILDYLIDEDWTAITFELGLLNKGDRDALLQPNGIFTSDQLKKLI